MEWDDITRLIELFKENTLGELEFEDERFRLKLKSQQGAPMAPVGMEGVRNDGGALTQSESESSEEEKGRLVTSPFVGTFYRRPAPDAPPYVEMGQTVSKGQVLCIVEAMKLMNEIEAECGGRIVKIYVENGRPVEFGEPLFLIEPL